MNRGLRRRHAFDLGLVWGQDFAGRPVAFQLGKGHFLYAGTTGAGKSGVTNALLAAAASRADVAIVGVDPKRVELPPWAARCAFVAVTPVEIDDTLRAVRQLMDARYQYMQARAKAERRPVRDWDPTWGAGGWVLLVVEELAEVFRVDVLATPGDRKAREHAAWRRSVLESLASLARAVGIVLLSSTQRPAAETIGADFRANHAHRLCLKVASEVDARVVLGTVPDGCEPWLLPLGSGWGELAGDTGTSLRVRARWLDDTAVATTVTTYAHLRAVAGTLPELLEAVR